jgi:hypothetical protein
MALHLGIGNDGTFVSSDGYTLLDSNDLSLMAISSAYKYKIILNNVVYRVNVNLKKEGE